MSNSLLKVSLTSDAWAGGSVLASMGGSFFASAEGPAEFMRLELQTSIVLSSFVYSPSYWM
jgi:hypothetical protein